jgi:hypothetical protein
VKCPAVLSYFSAKILLVFGLAIHELMRSGISGILRAGIIRCSKSGTLKYFEVSHPEARYFEVF